MILKHFQKYSNEYKDHLEEMKKRVNERDKEAIHVALYYISHYRELNTLLSDQCKRLSNEIYDLNNPK